MFRTVADKPVESTPFSEFVRNADPARKKRVYDDVLKKSTERQQRVIDAAAAAAAG